MEEPEFLPGDLRRTAAALRASGSLPSGQEICTANVKPDGSGITVVLAEPAENVSEKNLNTTVEGRTADSAIPITIDPIGLTVPAAGRQDDIYHIGGARWQNNTAGSRCTSGFAVRKTSNQQQGMMWAAHCGNLNDQISRTTSTPLSPSGMGNVTQRVASADAGIVTGTSYQGAVYSA